VDVAALLRECIGTVCGVPADRVRMDSDLDELGIDSLTSAEIIFELEIRMQRELPNQLLKQINEVRTVGDVAERLDAALGKSPTGPAPVQ
jgi:acyl carrier protein